MLKTLHGLISRRYLQGSLYLFPSRADVHDFGRGRFNPLINDNPELARHVVDTDTQTIKRIGRAMLYMRGARSTTKIQGLKRSSTALKSIPVDRTVFDESDEMAPDMIDLALERMSHSELKEEIYLSTPTIPDYGVDRLFQRSDQRHWFIKCHKCGGETCLELEFPACLEELADGRVIRLCQRCRDREIHPRDGHWRALYPNKAVDMVGWRISQLNSVYVDPAKILQLFRDPPNGNISEIYNSKLAQAHIAAENRLTVSEVLALCDPR
jgi:phage terminase large subunit GpA-like protein